MPTDSDLSQAVDDVQKGIRTVKQDLRNRPDYGDRHQAGIKVLDAFALALVGLQAKLEVGGASMSSALAELYDQAESKTLPLIADMLDANTRVAKMGILNPKQTISPARAKALAVNLTALQDEIHGLCAKLLAAWERAGGDVSDATGTMVEPGPFEPIDFLEALTSAPPANVPPPTNEELANEFDELIKSFDEMQPKTNG